MQLAALALLAVALVGISVFTGYLLMTEKRPAPAAISDTPADKPQDPAELKIKLAGMAVRSGGIIDTEIQMFRMHMSRYPESMDELLTEPAKVESPQKWRGPYISKVEILTDPWGQRYHYVTGNETARYKLWSIGPDGIDGSNDDIAN